MWSRLAGLSLSAYIFLGLILGALTGIFLGELVQPLDFIGKAFIKLLQMAVLPYIVVSLIHGIGNLSTTEARLMATQGSKLLLFLWTVGLVVIFSFALAFPLVQTSAFFTVGETTPARPLDFLSIYIPANIFSALSEGLIPAIVLFSVFLGVALIGVKDKQPFLEVLSVLSQALSRITHMVIKTAPLGVFALTATAAGTLTLDQLQRLQVYFVCYILITLILTFWVLPVIVSCLTSFKFRDILNYSKDALILGFVTGNNFVILPIIANKSKELFDKEAAAHEKTDTLVDTVVPLAYSFPTVGKLMELLFIVFVAWYVNQPLGLLQQLELAFSGVMSLFGSPKVGIPFLLNYMKLPGVYFDLYIISDVVTRKFKVLLQSMSIQAVTLILTFLILNKFKVNLKKALGLLSISLLLIVGSIFAARAGLSYAVRDIYREDIILMTMKIDQPVPARVHRPPIDPLYFSRTAGDKNEGLLTRIKKRGALRVGYNAEALPFAFFNLNGDLVGYDVFFAHRLARDLGVSLEFIPVENINLRAYLDEGVCDIVMSAVTITADKLGAMNFSKPYMDMKGAFVVKDYRKKDFQTQAYIEERKHLRIAFTPSNSQEERLKMKSYFPQAQPVELDAIRDFFVTEDVADALLTTDKIGKAWALLYPEFGVAVPEPVMFRYDLGYALPITKGDYVFLEYLNHWLKLQKTSGAAKQQFSYWILGQTPVRQTPRCSIIHNVLHWVD